MPFTDDDIKRFKEFLSGKDVWNFAMGQNVNEKMIALLARLEAHERLDDWLQHSCTCVRSSWCAGRPTADGGYEAKFGMRWYQQHPMDETPKCDCGLDYAYEAWRKAAGK